MHCHRTIADPTLRIARACKGITPGKSVFHPVLVIAFLYQKYVEVDSSGVSINVKQRAKENRNKSSPNCPFALFRLALIETIDHSQSPTSGGKGKEESAVKFATYLVILAAVRPSTFFPLSGRIHRMNRVNH